MVLNILAPGAERVWHEFVVGEIQGRAASAGNLRAANTNLTNFIYCNTGGEEGEVCKYCTPNVLGRMGDLTISCN